MAEKRFYSRVVHTHDIESNWKKATNFIPMRGEIVVYDTDESHNYERFKIGDGSTTINLLPFANEVDHYGLVEKEGAIVTAKCLEGIGIQATSYITATQEGSGWDAVTITRIGENLFDQTNYEILGLYINGSNFVSFAADRTVCVEIEPNTNYTVIKTHPSTMRLATSVEYPTAGGTSTQHKTGNNTTTTLTITSGADDKYLTIQLFASGDTSTDITTYTPTLRVYKTNSAQKFTANMPETIYGGYIDWNTGILTKTHDANLDELEAPIAYQLAAQQLIALQDANIVWSNCGDTHAIFNYILFDNYDKTLTKENYAADAKATGDAIAAQNEAIDAEISNLYTLIGDTSVSEQISEAASTKADVGAGVYTAMATSDDGIAYVATVPGIETLEVGASFIMIPAIVSASQSPTIDVNGLGAKGIKRRLSNLATAVQSGYTATWLAANKPFTLVYDGDVWVVEGLNKPVAADLYGTLSVAKGGTGATEPVEARENLLMVVSATEPISPVAGMLWFDIS